MATLEETIGAPSELGSNLQAGVEAISSNQTITFTKYVKVVLPLDGFVFWVKADKVGASALYNAALMNRAVYGGSPAVTPAPFITAQGSLHYATDTRQDEANTIAVNRVVFTSQQEIQDLNEVGPNVLFIGVIDGIKFAFSTRAAFYRQAELWHYVGFAVYSDMETQVVDDPRSLNTRDVIVSNSLPLWLALNGYQPSIGGFGNPGLTLYPSFLLPTNLAPPYAAVHIPPENTRALTGAPRISRDSSHSQLCADVVKITMFGMRNFNALDFLDCVLQRSLDYDEFGIMNMPVVRDEKRTQSELNAIAQKKSLTFEISYYQNRMNDIARQLILSAVPSFYPTDFVAA